MGYHLIAKDRSVKTMKLIGIVGSAAEVSTNRQLLNFIKKQYKKEFTLEL
ncbi:NADPH-dependent oxidoreductase, partial [Listeria monocytogenes]|nr:NADPH-dependent oxidoreductase [Listeria monocytogenes]